jgi:hypothetical protein
MKKPQIKMFEEFERILEAEGESGETAASLSEPVGLAVLGAPAGGKSYTMNKISDIANDARIKRTLDKGVVLTVDKLRDEFLSKDPIDQLQGFVYAFYLMKQKAEGNPEEFGKWFSDIQKLWSEKFSSILPDLNVSVKDGELLFNGKSAIENLEDLEKIDSKGLIDKLDKYNDYKRVVRYFQDLKQSNAIAKTLDVSYDEAGDEPTKIVANMDKLHKQGYVTDVFLIHPENVASNLVQNFYRVVTGGDGGRDSSGAIVQAYNDIEKNIDTYKSNAEKVIKVKSQEIEKTSDPLQKANVQDDPDYGDKPIDVFVQVEPMAPELAFDTFSKKLDDEKNKVFKAFLKYAAFGLKGIPEEAKKSLLEITKDMSNQDAIEVLRNAAETKKFVFKFGGVTPELVAKAEEVLK